MEKVNKQTIPVLSGKIKNGLLFGSKTIFLNDFTACLQLPCPGKYPRRC